MFWLPTFLIPVLQRNTCTIIVISSLAIITFVIYWPGLHSPLLLDDGPQLKPILSGINSSNWTVQYKEYILSTSSALKRPVSMGSFILNAAISGDNIWYWKLTNVLLHSLTGLVIYLLTSSLLSLGKNKGIHSFNCDTASLCVAAIWLFHPLQVSTVLYLVQRMTMLSTLFIMCALLLYIKGYINEINNKTGILNLLTSALVFFPLSVLSKENSAVYPLYILLISVYMAYISKIPFADLPKSIKIYNMVMLLLIIIGFVALIYYYNELVLEGYKFREFNLYERLFTESRVIVMYLTQIIFPFPPIMGFFHDDLIISKNILDPPVTFLSIIIIVSSIALAITYGKTFPLILLGLMFFYISHLLESTIFPLEIAFEHRNYIGTWGVIISLISCLIKIKYKRLYLIMTMLILSCITYYRVSIWANPEIMYNYMISVHPESPRLNTVFAEAYAASGKYYEALQYLDKNHSLGADLYRLNIQCLQTGKLNDGSFFKLIQSKDKISIHHYSLNGIITLANYGMDNKCVFSKLEFINFLKFIVNSGTIRNNDAQKILLYLAHYFYEQKYNNEAISALHESFLKNQSNPIPLFLMTEWLIKGNRPNESKKTFRKAKHIANNSFYDYSDFVRRIEPMLE